MPCLTLSNIYQRMCHRKQLVGPYIVTCYGGPTSFAFWYLWSLQLHKKLCFSGDVIEALRSTVQIYVLHQQGCLGPLQSLVVSRATAVMSCMTSQLRMSYMTLILVVKISWQVCAMFPWQFSQKELKIVLLVLTYSDWMLECFRKLRC